MLNNKKIFSPERPARSGRVATATQPWRVDILNPGSAEAEGEGGRQSPLQGERKSNMFKKMISFAVVAGLVLALAPAAQGGTILLGDPLIPAGLGVGDQFRILFTTTTKTNAVPDDLAYYNAFVTTAATATGSLLKDVDATWKAIASIDGAGGDARTNTGIPYSDDDTPIYRVDGVRLATDGLDLWTSKANPDAPPATLYIEDEAVITETGTDYGAGNVWTGTEYNGLQGGKGSLTSSSPTYGIGTKYYEGSWVANHDTGEAVSLPLYGVSDPLTILVPEPATLALLGLGGLGVLLRRRSRKA